MQGFYRSAAIVRRINDRLLQRFEEQFDGEAVAEPLDDDFELRRGYLAARDAGLAAARSGAGVRLVRDVGRASRSARPAFADGARAGRGADQASPPTPRPRPCCAKRFMALLRGPQPVKMLERMARLGVLGRWIPAFAQVSGRMQFDLFHVYTVDQHTLAVLRNLASFASGAGRRALLDRACGLAVAAQAGTAVAGRPVPRHRQGPRRRSFRTRRGRCARVLRCAWPVARPTPTWSNGWCASTC